MNALCGQHVTFLNVKPGGTERNNWDLTGIIIGNGKTVSVLYELCVIEAYGRTIGIALHTFNGGPAYYSLLKVRLLYIPDRKTALCTGHGLGGP